MYPDTFDYHRAGSVQEALDLLEAHGEENAELLAGGHSLIPMMKAGFASPDVLIDIGQIDAMRGIETTEDGVSIGAMTNYATVAESTAVRRHAQSFAEAMKAIGDIQVRNMGTVGGNIAHADPASDLPGAAIASNAVVVLHGPDGERTVDIDEFFFGMFLTDVGERELVVRIDIPASENSVGTYLKRPARASGYALVGVAAELDITDGIVTSASVGANGIMDHGVRLDGVEEALEGEPVSPETFQTASEAATDGLDHDMIMEDMEASADYRADLLQIYTNRALRAAAEKAA